MRWRTPPGPSATKFSPVSAAVTSGHISAADKNVFSIQGDILVKVLVLGSGVIGVTSAWFLAKAGHEVTVVDRQPAAGLETSYGNAGEVSPGYATPWAGPGVPMKAVKWLMMQHSPLVIRPSFDPHMWSWILQMLANCNHKSYEKNKSRMA